MRKRHVPPPDNPGGFHFSDAVKQLEAGHAAMEAGDMPRAVAAFSSAVSMDATLTEARLGLGIAQAQMGEIEQAALSFRLVLDKEPDNGAALAGLGTTLIQLDEEEEGATFLLRAVETNPPLPELYQNIAATLLYIGFYEETEQVIARGLAAFPDDAGLQVLRVQVFIDTERLADAKPLLEALLQREPDNPTLRFMYATTLVPLDEVDPALVILRDLRRDAEIGPRAILAESMILLEQGQTDEALKTMQQAVKPAREDPNLSNMLGNVYWRAEKLPEALAAFKRAVELDPDTIPAYEGIIRIGTALGDSQSALHAITTLEQLDPGFLDEIMEEMLPRARGNVQPTIHAPLPADAVLQLKITLKWSKPPIWRRVQVPANISLARLHQIIQDAMGWTDSHLHQFTIHGKHYGTSNPDGYGPPVTSESRAKLNAVGLGEKSHFHYEYDFGDGWEHEIMLEKVLQPEKGARYPICVKGKGACPPEDIGGIPGYYHFLEVLDNPQDPEYADMVDWCGGDFAPDAFDADEVNRRLEPLRKKAN